MLGLLDMYRKMRYHKYVMISTYARIVACIICALRGPGELRHMHIVTDPSEPQHIYGPALSTRFMNDRYVLRKITLYTESGLVESLRDFGLEFIYDLAPRRENLMQQRVACLDALNEESSQPSAVPLHFWFSFSLASFSLLSLASIILLLEHLLFYTKVRRTAGPEALFADRSF